MSYRYINPVSQFVREDLEKEDLDEHIDLNAIQVGITNRTITTDSRIYHKLTGGSVPRQSQPVMYSKQRNSSRFMSIKLQQPVKWKSKESEIREFVVRSVFDQFQVHSNDIICCMRKR